MNRLFFLLSLLGLLSLGFCARQDAPVPHNSQASGVTSVEKQDNVPEKAREVLRHVQETGQAPDGFVGGRVFENREGNLPHGGHYHEYDVNPKVKGKNRGPERLVIDETSGQAWYTPDHYRTFILIQ